MQPAAQGVERRGFGVVNVRFVEEAVITLKSRDKPILTSFDRFRG